MSPPRSSFKDKDLMGIQGNSALERVKAAYSRLNRDELVLFLKIRNLPTIGLDADLVSRLARHDSLTYSNLQRSCLAQTKDEAPINSFISAPLIPLSSRQRHSCINDHVFPDLPIEILGHILDHIGDWALAQAVGVPSSLPVPLIWSRANATDMAILTGSISLILEADPLRNPPSLFAIADTVRFGHIHVLQFFLINHPDIFTTLFQKYNVIPNKASRYGRTSVLHWWKSAYEQHPSVATPPGPNIIEEAVDSASRGGQVAALDWWLHAFPHLEYTEAALEYASSKNHLAVLDWWKYQHLTHGLPLKVGRVMDVASTSGNVQVLEWWAHSQIEFSYDRHALLHASCHNRVDVLQWWLQSGLELKFDQEILTGATRHNCAEVLEWWDKSGLPVHFRMCDIEEALEDSIGGRGGDARQWWKRKGVDFNANDRDWVKLQSLN